MSKCPTNFSLSPSRLACLKVRSSSSQLYFVRVVSCDARGSVLFFQPTGTIHEIARIDTKLFDTVIDFRGNVFGSSNAGLQELLPRHIDKLKFVRRPN